MATVLLVGEAADSTGPDGRPAPVTGRKTVPLRTALERVGYTVLPAEDCPAALDRLNDTLLPDLILVARPLRDTDVLDLCAQVRRDSTTARIPIVVIADSMVRDGADTGVDLIFPANVNAIDLAERLRRLF